MIEGKRDQDTLKMCLTHHGREELAAVLWRGDATNEWLYTSEVTGENFIHVTDAETCEHENMMRSWRLKRLYTRNLKHKLNGIKRLLRQCRR